MVEKKSGRFYARQILTDSGIAKAVPESEIEKLIDKSMHYGESRALEARSRYGYAAGSAQCRPANPFYHYYHKRRGASLLPLSWNEILRQKMA